MAADEAAPANASQRALDWVNFFIADVEAAFGPFVAVYLIANRWSQAAIGLLLTVGGDGPRAPYGLTGTNCVVNSALSGGSLGSVPISTYDFFSTATACGSKLPSAVNIGPSKS